MLSESAFTIRLMRPDDLDQAFVLSRSEGWNQTLRDWSLLLHCPESVCIVAEKDKMVVGTATAMNYENRIAWIGMVLVDKSLRGQGAGKLLLNNILGRLEDVESVKLDATPAGEPLYRKLGFIGEHQIIRMTCEAMIYPSEKVPVQDIDNIREENFSEILKLDRAIFGADRSYLLKNLLDNLPDKAFYLKKGNNPEGFILGRDGTRFHYIGPVCALSQISARHLMLRTLKSLNNQPVAIDVLEAKEDFVIWLESIGFVKQRQFLRMYLNRNPYPGMIDTQYLISGPEYG
jgi:GNAT superfamily N-acetyltransferase